MIQRVSDQNKINALEGVSDKHQSLKDRTPEMKKKAKKSKDRSWEKVEPASKFGQKKDDFIAKGNSIHSAQTGAISDLGGPSQNAKMKSSNSIFSPDQVGENMNKKTLKEITAEEKESSIKARAEKQAQWRESSQPKIGEVDSSPRIGRADCQEGSKGWVPSHNMSMFDTKEFERLASPEGEKIEKRTAKKDDSWRKPSKAMNTKDASANLVDRLMQKSDGQIKNNRQESAVERLFNSLNKSSE